MNREQIFSLLDNFTDNDWEKRKEASRKIVENVASNSDFSKETAFAVSDKLELCRDTRCEVDYKNILYWSLKTLGELFNSTECRDTLLSVLKDKTIKDKYREIAISELIKFPYDVEFRNALIESLCDHDWKIRQMAARKLWSFTPEDVSNYLIAEFHNMKNDDVIYWILKIIARQLGDDALKFFENTLYSSPTNTKLYVLIALAEIGTEKALKLVVNCFDDQSYLIRTQVHQIVAKNLGACAKYVNDFAFSIDFRTRCEALKFLIMSKDPEYHNMITQMVTQGTTENKILGLISLGDVDEKLAADFIYDRFSDDSWYIRNFAASTISKYGRRVWKYLMEKYRNESNANNRYWILICFSNIIGDSLNGEFSDLASIFKVSKKSEKLQILSIVSKFIQNVSDESLISEATNFFIDALTDSKWVVRKEAARELQNISASIVSRCVSNIQQLSDDQKFWIDKICTWTNVRN